MDDPLCRRFFLEPEQTFHRRYEALRAVCVEGRPVPEVAAQFGYKLASLQVMVSTFRAQCRHGDRPPFLFPTAAADHRAHAAAQSGTGLTSPRSPTSDS
jgi:hypothetical protein